MTQPISAAESLRERIDIIFHELELAVRWQTSAILLVTYAYDLVMNDAAQALTARLQAGSQQVQPIVVSEDLYDIPLFLSQQPGREKTIYFISHLSQGGGEDQRNAYRALNIRREYFTQYHLRAVFWLTEQETFDLPRFAPDFWAFRSRSVELLDAPDPARLAALTENGRPKVFLSAVEVAELNAQIAEQETWLKALNNSPETTASRANLLYNLAVLHWARQDTLQAANLWRKTLSLAAILGDKSLEAACYTGLGAMLRRMGDFEQALDKLRQAVDLDPQNVYILSELERVFLHLGQVANAEYTIKQMLPLEKGAVIAQAKRLSSGISADLLTQVRATLLECGPFDNSAQLRSIFIDERTSPWRNNIPEADNVQARVDAIISYLYPRSNVAGDNALVLFLQVLADRTHLSDSCHTKLLFLANQLQHSLNLVPVDKLQPHTAFLTDLWQQMLVEYGFRDLSQNSRFRQFPFIGYRVFFLQVDSVAFVPADRLSRAEIIALHQNFFSLTQQISQDFPGIIPQGVLGFVFESGCSPEIVKFVRRQTQFSYAAGQSAVTVSWAIDLPAREIHTHRNPLSFKPPVVISPSQLYPNPVFLREFLQTFPHT